MILLKFPPWRRRGRGSLRYELKLDRHVGVAFQNLCGKAKVAPNYEYLRPKIMHLWNLYVLTSPPRSLATHQRTLHRDILPDVKG